MYFNELNKLIKNSYSPYSKFHVAAIAVDNEQKIYYGVNVENCSIGATSCAERNAIFSAISSGLKMGNIKEVHVLAKNENIKNEGFFVTPCGICRQVIDEASEQNATIFLYNLNSEVKKFTIKELLPFSFEKGAL